MTTLQRIGANLTQGQLRNLARAIQNNDEVTLRISHRNLQRPHSLMVPANVVKRMQKSKSSGKGMQIKISRSNIRKQDGSGIFSAVLPAIRSVAPVIGKTLGLSALAGAASEGASQIIKKITGGQIFQIFQAIILNGVKTLSTG